MPAVQAPTSVALSSLTCTGATVTWTDGANSTSHTCQIYESDSSDMSFSTPVSPQTPSNSSAVTSGQAFTFTPTSGKYYGAIVTAVQDNEGTITTADSSMSTGVEYVAIPPANPTSVTLGSFTGTGATVSWTSTDPCTESYDCYIYEGTSAIDVAEVAAMGSSSALAAGTGFTSSPQTIIFTPTATKWYLATVTAISGGLTSDAIPSSAIEYPAAPNPPTAVTIDSLTGTTIVVTWTAPTTGGTVAGYLCQIYQSDTEGDMASSGTRTTVAQFPAEYDTVASGQSFTISATSGKYYGAIVTSVNIAGTAASDVSAASLYTAPPGIPTVNAPTNTGSTLNMSWNAPGSGGSLTGYKVQVLKDTDTEVSLITLGDVTSTTYSPMESGTPYKFYVYATGPGGSGGQSSTSSTVTYYTPPVAPTSVTVSLLTGLTAGGGLKIDWSGDSGADSFNVNIYYKSSSGVTTGDSEVSGSFTSVSTGQNFTFSLTDLTYYAATVTAVNQGGEVTSTISSSVEYIAPPGAPTSIIRSALSGTGMTVAWTAGSGTDSYKCQIYSSTTSDMQTSRTLVSDQDPANDEPVISPQAFLFTATNGLYYGAIVTAVNAGPAVTASSTTSSFTGSLYTAPPTAPTSVTLSSLTGSGASVAWSGGSGASSYTCQLFYSSSSDMSSPTTVTQSPSNSSTVTTPQAFTFTAIDGKYYGAKVTAVNGGGSDQSAMSTGVLYTAPPTAPTSVTLSSLTGSGASVAWSGGSGASSYTCQLFYSSSSDMSSPTTVTQSPSNSSTVTTPQAFTFTAIDGKYYGAKVTAVNGGGSDQSAMSTGVLYTASMVCFKEDTKILCKINNIEQYIPIQDLRKGVMVKTLNAGFKPIVIIGWKEIKHTIYENRIPDQLYVCSKDMFPEATEDLIITGAHSILVDLITDNQRKEIEGFLGKIYITEKKYRMPTCIDPRTRIYQKEGEYNIYHFALEHDNYHANYGVYANGILVESSSERYLKELSTMSLIE